MKDVVLSLGLVVFFLSSTMAQVELDTTATQQLDEVVVTDTKFKIKKENSGKVISTITAQELENLKGMSVSQILNSVAGVEINGAMSNDGQNLNYYIRGGRNRQVLIVIDGIQLTDPSQIANDYDLRLLQTEQIEKIEILKGAASTLYGSGAATAVINITTKEAADRPFAVNFSVVMGTNQSQNDKDYDIQSFQNNAMISGSVSGFDYKLGVSNKYSNGISAIKGGSENDSYDGVNTVVELGYSFNNNFRIKGFYKTDRAKAQFDDGFSLMDADNLSTSHQERVGVSMTKNYDKGSIVVNSSYNTIDRTIESSFPAIFKGDSYVVDAYNKLVFNSKFYTVLGVNVIDNKMKSFSIPFGENQFVENINAGIADFTIIDPYVNVLYTSDKGFNLNSGLRVNNHSEYGSHFIYSINPSFNFDTGIGTIKALASYSTAYITPSLYQLFEPSFGNIDLQPEENSTLEIGTGLTINDGAEFSLVFFNRNEKNFIDFVDLGNFVFQYNNIDEEFTASGLEFTSKIAIGEKLILNTNATYTKVEEDLNLRIPEIKINSSISYNISQRITTRLDYHYTDKRQDLFFDPETFERETVNLESFNLVDFFIKYQVIKDKASIFLNVQNIFNEEYVELFGYTTKGRNLSLGLNILL